jgi:hypothetical protein
VFGQKSELVASLKLGPLIAAKAKAQQGIRTDLLPNLAKSNPINTRAELAKLAGVSHGTLDKGKLIMEHAHDWDGQTFVRIQIPLQAANGAQWAP